MSFESPTHTLCHPLAFSMYWLWLILHLILLSSLPSSHSCHYFRLQFSTHELPFPFSTLYPLPPGDSCLPAPLQLLAQGGDQGQQGHRFLFLAQFWGISNVPTGLSLPPSGALPQGKMLSRHTFKNCFFRNQHWGIHGKPTTELPQKLASQGPWGPR